MSGSKVLILAGEASGDLHAASLIKALRKRSPHLDITCVGGEKMKAAGATVLVPSSQLSVVGLFEVFHHVRPIASAFIKVRRWMKKTRPDIVILVDFPEFNLMMASYAKSLGLKVFYYISPQVWAWRKRRVKKIKRCVDKMAVILPFEEEFFKEYGIDATFVGHPLLDSITVDKIQDRPLKESIGIGRGERLVCLLPGSRKGEIERHFPIMAEAASIIEDRFENLRFLVALNSGTGADAKRFVRKVASGVSANIHTVEAKTHEAIKASDICIAASGTVTLESAIIGTPVIVMYKVNPLSYALGKKLIQVKWVSLVNLIAEKELVPELLQNEASPERIASNTLEILNDPVRQSQIRSGFDQVVSRLGTPGASKRAAGLIMEFMSKAP